MQNFSITDYERDKAAFNRWLGSATQSINESETSPRIQAAVRKDVATREPLSLPGPISTYYGVATAGLGVAPIRSAQLLLGKTAAIAATKFLAVPRQSLWRVSYYFVIKATGAAGNLTLTLGWTDPQQAQTLASTAVAVTATGNYTQGSIVVLGKKDTSLTYTTTFSTNTATYDLYITAEELM